MATNVNNETGLIGITPKYKFHDQVTIDTGDTIQDVTWLDCEYLAKFKKNSLGPMIVRPDYIYEDTSGNLARNGVTIVGVTTENTLARVTDPEVLRILLANISHTLDNQIRLSEVASGSIGAAWFAGNTKIEIFDCPRGYSVAASAFNGCTGLREVFIQRNVSLGNSAFNGCNRVDCYHFLDTNVGTFGTTVFAGLSGSCYLYVPNESVVNYCKVANLGSYINRIRGHIKGWHLICTDGSYKYNLHDCYDTATNISFRLEGTYVTNLALSVDPETNEATVTVTGMLPDTDENAQLYYEFDYRNHHFSGYVPLHLKTGAAEIIEFEDPEVKRICVANWGGIYRMTLDGYEGELTKEQAAKVSSIGTVFMKNTKIKYFEELTKFTYSTVLDGYNGSFMGCTNLERVDLTGKTHLSPRETSDKPSYGLFGDCSNLQTIGDISNINIIPYYAFYHCSKLKEKIITTATSLRGRCFEGCNQIPSIIILTSTVPSLIVTYGTIAIAGTTCPIYVRPELYRSFMVATNWSSYRSRIKNFFTGPVLIIKDGVYTYSLRTEAFEEYQGLTFSIDENDYLSLNFDGETATITASGIVSGVDEPVGVHYSFIYRGKEVSGTFNISVTYKEIIEFEDAEAKRICVNNWGGEYCASTNKYGMKGEITYEQAAAVSSIGTKFNNNQVIKYFMELQYFTKITSLNGSTNSAIPFYNCRNLKRIKLPEGVTGCQNAFRQCASLTFIELPSTLTGTINYYTFGGNPSTPANKKLVVHFNSPLTMTASGAYGTYCGTFNRGIYVPDEYIDEFRAAAVWKNNNIYPLSEWDGTY